MLKWTNALRVQKLFITFYSVVLSTYPSAKTPPPVSPTSIEHSLSISAPSPHIIIRNHSFCPLSLLHFAHYNNQTTLTLPERIEGVSIENQYAEGAGHVSFSGGYFSSMQQRATGTYKITCGNKRYLLNLSFFIAPDHYGDGYFIDKTLNSEDSPVILYPPGKTSIMGNTPIVLTLINKEATNDSRTEPSSSTDPKEGEDVVADDASSGY